MLCVKILPKFVEDCPIISCLWSGKYILTMTLLIIGFGVVAHELGALYYVSFISDVLIFCLIQIGASALMVASQEGYIKVIQLLLDHGAELDLQAEVYA